MTKEKRLLCPRCEYRVQNIERKVLGKNSQGPRFECKMLENSVHSCYMFTPVKPVFVQPRDSRHPIPGSLLSSRIMVVQDIDEDDYLRADIYPKSKDINEGYSLYWRPKLKLLIKHHIQVRVYNALKSLKHRLFF